MSCAMMRKGHSRVVLVCTSIVVVYGVVSPLSSFLLCLITRPFTRLLFPERRERPPVFSWSRGFPLPFMRTIW